MACVTIRGSCFVFLMILPFLLLSLNKRGVDGFRIQIGHCPEPPKGMSDFDIGKYLGTWHQQKTDVSILSLFGKCPKQILTLNEQKQVVDVKNSLKLSLGFTSYFYNYEIEGFAKPVEGEVGKLEVNLYVPVVGWRQSPLWILRTDYENYAIAWSCSDFRGFFNIQTGFILSRSPTPSPNYNTIVNQQLTELKLFPEEFVQLDQSDCQ